MLRGGLKKEFSILMLSTIFFQFSSMVVNLVGAKFLGPTLWGKWNILRLFLLYGPNMQLGTLNAMNREIPFLRGRGEWELIKKIQKNVLSFHILIGTFLAVFIGALLFLLFPKDLLFPGLLMGFLMLFTVIYVYFQVYLKSSLYFFLFGKQQFFLSVFLLLLLPVFVSYPKLSVFILIRTVSLMVVLWIIWKSLNFHFVFELDFSLIRKLIKIGWPILAVGLIHTATVTTDRIVIAKYLGSTQVGYYSIALMAMNVTLLIPMIVGQQIYPRIAESWGETNNIIEVLKWMRKQMEISAGASILIATIIAFTIKPLLVTFLPKYLPGLPAVYPVLLIPVLLSFSGSISNVMNSLGEQRLFLAVQFFSLIVLMLLDISFVKMGYGITGVAWATVIAFALNVIGAVLTLKFIIAKYRR